MPYLLKGQALDRFTLAYLEAALWSSLDDDGESLDETFDLESLTDGAIDQARSECHAFQAAHADTLAPFDDAQAGHDFWLTRNGHGAGFWDGDYPEPAASVLTEASHRAGERHLIIEDGCLLFFPVLFPKAE